MLREGGTRTAFRVARVLATAALALVLVMQLPSLLPPPGSPMGGPGEPVITFRTDATSAEIAAAGADVLETYQSFTVARGPESGIAFLQGRGRYAQSSEETAALDLLGGSRRIATLALRTTNPWTIDAAGQSIGVVHFHAPIKAEWTEGLLARGISVLRYLPQDAFVVRGPPANLQALAGMGPVDWVGPYQAEWKIRPGMPADGLVDVRIVVFDGESPEAVRAWLGHAGIPAAAMGGTGPATFGTYGSGDFRWVRARVPAGFVPGLAALPAVEFIDRVAPVRVWNAQTDWVIQSNSTVDYRYWSFGLAAQGQIVGMSDTGLDFDGAPFRHSPSTITLGDIYNATDASRRKVARYLNMGVLTGALTWPGGTGTWDPFSIKDCAQGHGTGVASTIAGNDDGIGSSPNDGNALEARIYLQDIGGFQGTPACPNEGLIYLPEDFDELFGPAGLVYNDPAAPVRIHSNSWGTDTNVYDVQARMVDAFVWAHPDMTIVFAAGNAGSTAGSVGTPGTAKAIVTAGGAGNPDPSLAGTQNDLASLSSRGPTIDGRIKPTILTIFDGDSAMSDGDPASGTGAADQHWAGTSYSTPAAAAAAAIVRQYFVDGWYPAARPVPGNGMNPSAALVRAMLIASGVQVTGNGMVSRSPTDTWPNNEQGFGRVLLSRALPIALAGDTFRTQVIDNAAGLLTGDAVSTTVRVGSAGPMKFVLAWSDYPGTLGATKAIVNDLDLEVTAPDGTVYRGNRFAAFAQGQSLAGGAFDTTNVEEAVILKNAIAGDWTVRVIAANVPVGPQPFALAAVGNVDTRYARIGLDKVAYSEADTIRIAVEDSDATSAVVHVTSGIEPAGEDVVLGRSGLNEIWRGSIATAFGTAASGDGVLQVRQGDTVRAVFQDTSPPHAAMATAQILASGPTIHDVVVTEIGATTATVRWATSEPATTEVAYAEGAAPPRNESTPELRTTHAIALAKLLPDTTYRFNVTSRGRLGNATTDANGGAGYAFQTAPYGDVLLVVGASFPPEREASYRAALNGNGWTWTLWRLAELGLPPLAVLQGRRAVIWQVGLEQYPPFNASARDLVRAYLDGGGRLIVSSHDTAWALGSTGGSSPSPFASPESAAWVRGVLKATFTCDPLSIVNLRGVTGDPVSGAYTTGAPYAAHRDGGADDQFTPTSAGGTSSTMWTDVNSDAVCPTENRPTGLRWISSSANGSAGPAAWGGMPSRVAYFGLEITGIDATATDLRTSSPTRSAILDSALRWLVSTAPSALDRDHPDVNITSPNGGTFTAASIPVGWTATAYGSGVSIAGFTLFASGDGGQTWSTLATLPGMDRTFAWDLGGAENGDRYRLRIVARDTGTPALTGADITDAALTIRRTGGDSVGPILWAGSVRLDPWPPGAALPVTFTATADDRMRGASAIASAELFLRPTPPGPGADGTGLAMSPLDGAFDDPVENATWQGALPVAPGATCAWSHGRDAAGNWGPYASVCFVVINAGPDTVPPALATPDAVGLANGSQDLTIGWTAAWDDALFGGTTEYRVERSTSPRGPYADVGSPIPASGSPRYTFLDPGRAADASDYFYRIVTVDAAAQTSVSILQAAKVRIAFAAGLNLLGMPLTLTDPAFGRLSAGLPWSAAWTYDGCAAGFPWSSALPTDPTTFALPAGRGIWVNGTTADFVTALGTVAQTSSVRLCTGWNLVAIPGFRAGVTVQALKAATGAVRVTGFDAAGPYHVRPFADAEVLAPGIGYWVQVPADVTWIMPGW